MCFHALCHHRGCSENFQNHSTLHYKAQKSHCIQMNMSSHRLWCYRCEREVALPTKGRDHLDEYETYDDNDEDENDEGDGEDDDDNYEMRKGYDNAQSSSTASAAAPTNLWQVVNHTGPRNSGASNMAVRPRHTATGHQNRAGGGGGLLGLRNLKNTCYLNAALQALSNSPPLVRYFLDCESILEVLGHYAQQEKRWNLARSFHYVIAEMWQPKVRDRCSGYVVPHSILAGIQGAFPMFRGFQQHDTQEFLRCLMDQLHEDLKEESPPPPPAAIIQSQQRMNSHRQDGGVEYESEDCSSQSSSSEAEYDTCDSGVSEQSHLSNDVDDNVKPFPYLSSSGSRSNYSRSTSPSNGGSNQRIRSRQSTISMEGGQQQQQTAQQPPKAHRSIISDVFDGKLLSSVQCLTCDRVSTREETFQASPKAINRQTLTRLQ